MGTTFRTYLAPPLGSFGARGTALLGIFLLTPHRLTPVLTLGSCLAPPQGSSGARGTALLKMQVPW